MSSGPLKSYRYYDLILGAYVCVLLCANLIGPAKVSTVHVPLWGSVTFMAGGLCLIANTSPVAYGGFGTPILTLQSVTGLDAQKLSAMAGNQLPLLSCIVPFWLVRCMCGWKETLEVWPAIAVAGGSFAVCQFVFAHSAAFFGSSTLSRFGPAIVSS